MRRPDHTNGRDSIGHANGLAKAAEYRIIHAHIRDDEGTFPHHSADRPLLYERINGIADHTPGGTELTSELVLRGNRRTRRIDPAFDPFADLTSNRQVNRLLIGLWDIFSHSDLNQSSPTCRARPS